MTIVKQIWNNVIIQIFYDTSRISTVNRSIHLFHHSNSKLLRYAPPMKLVAFIASFFVSDKAEFELFSWRLALKIEFKFNLLTRITNMVYLHYNIKPY